MADQRPATPAQPVRPFPAPVAAGFTDFLAGLAQRRLTIRQCAACAAVQWPPRVLCQRCRGDEFGAITIGDRGVVHTFSVCYRAFDPWFASRVPYGIVVADLGDGIRLTGNYLGDDLDELRCGLPVRAAYEVDGGRAWLGWIPADGPADRAGRVDPDAPDDPDGAA